MKYYVYVFLDPRKPGKYKYGEYEFDHEPFYIGKGKGNRISQSLRDGAGFKRNVIKSIRKNGLEPISYKLLENLSESKSLESEEIIIEKIGRRDLKRGPLSNLTNGGEGTSNPTKEVREKISKANKGKKLSLEQIEGLRDRMKGNSYSSGIKHSEETKNKISKGIKESYASGKSIPWNLGKKYTEKEKIKFISEGFKGKNHSEETKRKLSEFQTGKSFENKVGKKKSEQWKKSITKGLKEAFKNGLTGEHKKKLSKAITGFKHTEKTKKKMSESSKGRIPWNKGIRIIHQLDLEGNFIKEWKSFQDIKDELGLPQSNLCKCCQGERKTVGGFIWKYKIIENEE